MLHINYQKDNLAVREECLHQDSTSRTEERCGTQRLQSFSGAQNTQENSEE